MPSKASGPKRLYQGIDSRSSVVLPSWFLPWRIKARSSVSWYGFKLNMMMGAERFLTACLSRRCKFCTGEAAGYRKFFMISGTASRPRRPQTSLINCTAMAVLSRNPLTPRATNGKPFRRTRGPLLSREKEVLVCQLIVLPAKEGGHSAGRPFILESASRLMWKMGFWTFGWTCLKNCAI